MITSTALTALRIPLAIFTFVFAWNEFLIAFSLGLAAFAAASYASSLWRTYSCPYFSMRYTRSAILRKG